MTNGVQVCDHGGVHLGSFEPDEFGREVRRLALDAHRILKRPDSPMDELLRLHARVWHLLREVPRARPIGVFGWLLAVRQRIGVRLQSWTVEDLESLAG